jgi:hypothetical protein
MWGLRNPSSDQGGESCEVPPLLRGLSTASHHLSFLHINTQPTHPCLLVSPTTGISYEAWMYTWRGTEGPPLNVLPLPTPFWEQQAYA